MSTENLFNISKEPAGHIRLEYKPGIDVTLEMAEQSVTATNALGGGSYRLMIVMSGLRNVAPDARDFLAGVVGPTAVALVVSSPVDRIVANAFLAVGKPSAYKLHAFSSESEAAEWLKQEA